MDRKRRNVNRRIFWYFLVNILVFVLLAGGTVLAARPLQRRILAGMTELRDLLIREGEAALGFNIEYRSLGPSVFGFFDVRRLVIFGGESGQYTREKPLVSLDRMRISFSLWKLLAGDLAGSLRAVRLERPVFSMSAGDNPELRRLAGYFQGQGRGGGPSFLDGIDRPLRVSIRRGECSLHFGESAAGFQNLNFDVRVGPDEISLRGKWLVNLQAALLPGRSVSAGIGGRLSGNYKTETRRGTVTLNIPAIQGESFTISAVNFHIALNETGLVISKISDSIPYALNLAWDYAEKRLSGEFRADNFSPRQLLILSGSLQQYNRHLGMRLDGTASFEAGGGTALAWRVDMNGELGAVGPFSHILWRAGAEGSSEGVSFSEFRLNFPRGEIGYHGGLVFSPLSPEGTLSLRDFSVSGGGAVNGDVLLESRRGTVTFSSKNLALGDLPASVFRGELVRPAWNQGRPPPGAGDSDDLFVTLTFLGGGDRRGPGASAAEPEAPPESAERPDAEPSGSLPEGGVRLGGDYSANPRGIQASLGFNRFSARDLLEMLKPFVALPSLPPFMEAEAERLAVSSEIFLNTDFSHLSWDAPRILVEREGEGGIIISASVSGTNSRFELADGIVVLGDEQVEFSGIVDAADPEDIYFSASVTYRDLSWAMQGVMTDGNALSLSGAYDLAGGFQRSPQGTLSGWLQAGPMPFPPAGESSRLSLGLSFRYAGKRDWNALLERFEISGIPAPGSTGALFSLTGQANQNGGGLGEILYDDGRNPLSGQAWFARQDSGWTGEVRLESAGSRESCVLGVLWRDAVQPEEGGRTASASLEMTLRAERFQLDRLFRTGFNPAASGTARLVWVPGADWSLTVDLQNLSARRGETLVEAGGQAALDGDGFQAWNITATWGGLAAMIPRLEFSLDDSRLDTAGHIQGALMGRNFEMSFRAGLDLGPAGSWAGLAAAAETLVFRLDVDSLLMESLEPVEPFSLVLRSENGNLDVEGGPGDMIRLSLDNEGAFFANLSRPSPLRGAFSGFITSGYIDVATSSFYIDLDRLFAIIPENGACNCKGGIATGRLRVQGPLGDPEFFGAIYGTGVRLAVPAYLGAEIGPTPITAALTGNEMTFGPQYARVGNGAGIVNAWFRFERWIPDTFRIDIRAPESSPLPYAVDIEGVIATGDVSGSLIVEMENREMRVIGDLNGENTEIILDMEEMAAGQDAVKIPSVPYSVDISISAGKKVDFYWPDTSMPTLRATAAAGSGIRIVADSLSGRMSMKGDVTLKSGEINYITRSFYLREGLLVFDENEMSFEPRITARAELRERSDDGPVTIAMIVENEPLTNFSARFESSPPLSQAEIAGVLGQSITGVSGADPEEEGNLLQSAALAGTDILVQYLGLARLERGIRNFLGLDMFSFRTSLLRNFVSSSMGWTPVDRRQSIGNYFDNTNVYIGKYVGTSMFIQGMVSVRYDEAASLRSGAFREGRGLLIDQVSLEPDIGIELNTPLFDIRWNLTPMHIENLFVDDMSFTLIWRWAFR